MTAKACSCAVVEEVYSEGGDIVAFQCVRCNRAQRVKVCHGCNAILNGESAHKAGCEPGDWDNPERIYDASETSEENPVSKMQGAKGRDSHRARRGETDAHVPRLPWFWEAADARIR